MEYTKVLIEEIMLGISMGPFGSDIKRECYVPSGIPYLNGSNVQGFKLGESSFIFVPNEKAQKLNKSLAHRGDVIVTHRGTVGQIVYVPSDSLYEEYLISNSQFRVTLDQNKVLPEYFVYYFHTREGQNKLLSNVSQVGVPALARPTSSFRKLSINLPSLNDQRKIVEILLSIDRKIELNNRINHNLEEQAQAIYKSWFVDFEPFKDGEFVESELGLIPEGWTVKKAEEFCDINIGKTPPRKEHQWFSNDSSDVTWISISDMGASGVYISSSSEMLTKDACKKFNVIIVPEGTVLLSFKLTVGRVSIAAKDLTTNEAIARFLPTSDALRSYMYLALKLYDYSKLGSTSSIATAVNSKIIKGMPLLCPPADIIEKFGVQVIGMFNSIRTLQNEISCLCEQRDLLLPKLMSGEMKINEIDC